MSERCSNCGKLWAEPACGPTHALLAAERLPFTEEAIKAHLDNCIQSARATRDLAIRVEDRLQAEGAVDAFQSVRTSIFGELLL